MKVLSQNKQQIINLEQAFKVSIETKADKPPTIVATNANGLKSMLGMYLPREVDSVFEELLSSKEEVFKMPRSERYSAGRPLTTGDLRTILNHLHISNHAAQRMVERGFYDSFPTSDQLNSDVRYYIENNVLSFWNEDGTASIAVDNSHYFVVQLVYTPIKQFVVLTYNDVSENGYTVFDKQKIARIKHSKGEKQ